MRRRQGGDSDRKRGGFFGNHERISPFIFGEIFFCEPFFLRGERPGGPGFFRPLEKIGECFFLGVFSV